MLPSETIYNALLRKDSAYEGIFFAAITTTGIFCRPTCTARKPKRENVLFFSTSMEALQSGYRPCKVCYPLEKLGETPAPIKNILREISNNPRTKFSDEEIRLRGMEPKVIRRWFKKNYGATFQSYQRMLRMNLALKKLNDGESISSVAFDAGFSSLSGFSDSFKAVVGVSPSRGRKQYLINSIRLETPLGPMIACATEKGICLLEFSDRRMLATQLKTLMKTFAATIIHGANKHLETLQQQLEEYFQGNRKKFTLPLLTPGTDFQQAVWKELQNIPYGTTRSYKQQALAMGNVEAVRAVANANGMNRIAIVIPCHRVIGEDGHLTGYGGGLWRKKWLLDLEMKSVIE
jgi:AraC family transcriptional regulator of adaptative response/methylated-DNA-[protein]-cysteine methyltransferase